MIVVELSFLPTEERLSARPAHRVILERLHGGGALLAAGPWTDDTGALLIFNAERTAVDEIMADDPYYTTNGVTVTSIRDWTTIVGPT